MIGENDKNIYLNNESLIAQGNLKITNYYMSPLKARTNTIQVPGINGVLDLSYSLFDYLRYEEREFKIEFVVFEETKDMAMEVIKRINEIILKQKVKFSFAKDSAFYTEGRVENSVEYEQEFNGLYYCSITIYCYPYATKYYQDNMLWDDIYFPTDYFNILSWELESNNSKTISLFFPKDFADELEVYTLMQGGVFVDLENNISYQLNQGKNKIILLSKNSVGQARSFRIQNTGTTKGIVKISFNTEVLEYV